MARNLAVSIENNFKNGLITEASGLNYPENSCVDTLNCEFDYLGRVTRRPGFDLENGYTTQTVNRDGCVIVSYLWRNVTGDGTISFIVVQIGNKLYFYNSQSQAALSAGLETGTIDLTSFSPSGAAAPRLSECQFSDGRGCLFVVHPQLESFFVTYNAGLDTFTATQITLQIRDFQGLAEAVTIDNRPTSLTTAHKYNIYNQGWNPPNDTYITTFHTAMSAYPSNADVWWTFKDSTDLFAAAQIPGVARGNTPAPPGHYLLNVYNQDRTTASGITGITAVTTGTARVSCTAFFAGRVWYGGVNYSGFNSKLYFSQIITDQSNTQFGNCYQAEDPTSETLFDLLPDDGGVIEIPEAGTILKLFVMQTALVVFAYRGVWVITGSAGLGFAANDYSIQKISNYRITTPTSFIEVNGFPIFWTADGIFNVSGNASELSGVKVTPISWTTIQTYFETIPLLNREYARGYFNPLDQTITWLYRQALATTIDQNYQYDSALVMSILTGAFSKWTISQTGVFIHGLIVTDAITGSAVESQVIDAAAENVIDAASENVVVYNFSSTPAAPTYKYLVSYSNGSGSYNFTWAECNDSTNWLDWNSYTTSSDYSSYFITGYKVHGDAQRKFQPNYVYVYHQGTGAFDIQGIWDYSLSGNTGKYTSTQTLTYGDDNYSNNHKRIKMRGSGIALQYKISSRTGQPFTLIGWSAYESANSQP